MSTPEHDEIDETLRGQLRVGLTAGGRLAEQMARDRQQALQRAQADSETTTRALRARWEAERATARAAIAGVGHDRWWQSADAVAICDAWRLAQTWRGSDPEFDAAGEQIAARLRRDHGIDVTTLAADRDAVAATLDSPPAHAPRRADERDAALVAALVETPSRIDAEAVEAQRMAALHQARPAADAVAGPRAPATSRRPVSARSPERDRER